MCSPGLLESMETMAKLWLVDTASSPLILLLLSFAFSLGSGNAEGSSNGLGDFPLLVFFFCLCVSWVSQSSALSPVSSPCFVTCLSVFVSVLAGRQTKTMIHEGLVADKNFPHLCFIRSL